MIAVPFPIVVDDGVTVWCFAGPDMWALTDDETGQGLPADLGPWTLRKHLTVDGTNPDEAEALRLTPDEVRTLSSDRQPLFLAGQRPVIAAKLRYYADREFAGRYDQA